MKCIRVAFCLLLLLSAVRSPGQSWSYRQYTAEQGLPSTEVYDIIQDSKGYIWVATDRGVARFDGYNFESFTTVEGLSNNTVFRICEGPDGKIWFGEMPGTLSYYENGVIRPAPENEEIRKIVRHGSVPHCIIAGRGYVDVSYTNGRPLRLQNGRVEVLYAGDTSVQDVVAVHGNEVLFGTRKRQGRSLVVYHQRYYFFEEDWASAVYRVNALKRLNGELFVTLSGTVRIFDANGLRRKYPRRGITSFFETPDSSLFVTMHKGFYHFPPGEPYVPDDRYLHLKDCRVAKVIMDRDGGLWIATLDKGVLYCANTSFRTYDFKEDFAAGSSSVYSLCGDKKGKVFAGLHGGTVCFFRAGKKPVRLFPDHSFYGHIFYDEVHRRMLVARRKPATPALQEEVTCLPIHTGNGCVAYKGGYLLGSYNSLEFLSPTSCQQKFPPRKIIRLGAGVQCIFRLAEDSIFLGTLNGLWIFRKGALSPLLTGTGFENERINDIECIDRRTLVLATIGRGLLLYDMATGKVEQVTRRNGLVSDVINDASIAGDGTIWLAGNKGLSRLRRSGPGRYDVLNYTSYSGIPAADIKNVHVDGRTVYMGSHIGLTVLDTGSVAIDHDPEIRLRSVHVNDRIVQPDELGSLSPGDNNLRIGFLSIIPRMQGKVLYRYRLDASGKPGSWVYVREPQLFLSSVEPGDYAIVIQASNSSGQWSKTPLVLRFHIALPFWKSWAFLVCCILVATGFIALFQSFRMKQLRKKTAAEKLMLDYQQQALINQINPHFLFNSMNSIQKYILREDKARAVSFVSKFAKLMRLGLEHSREEFILLRKELELLQIYMLLEKERFGKKITYTPEIQPGLDKEQLMIPPMLIQPFLENAIRHGILNKDTDGEVVLRLYRNDHVLFCEVEDDGVGRQKAIQVRQEQEQVHRSFAININTSRLQLLSQSRNSDYFFEVTDKYDPQGNASGTLVKFIIPFKHEP